LLARLEELYLSASTGGRSRCPATSWREYVMTYEPVRDDRAARRAARTWGGTVRYVVIRPADCLTLALYVYLAARR